MAWFGLLALTSGAVCGEEDSLTTLGSRKAASRTAEASANGAGLDVTKAGQQEDAPHLVVPLSSIPVLKTVLRRSDEYSIGKEVKVDGYYYRFQVRCAHGEYEADSVRHLIKLCREIEVLEGFRKSDHENHVWTGVAQAAKGIGMGFANILSHPGQTFKTVGRSTGRVFRSLGAPFRDKAETKASDGTDRALLGKGPAGGERRAVAYELGLDVYTSNPAAQILIQEVASKRFAGKLPLNIGVFALPGGAVFTLALTPMGHDLSTEVLIRDNSPDELKRLLGFYYLNQFGIDWRKKDTSAQTLLDNPNYSPREQAYIGLYMNDLRTLKGAEEALDFLSKVDSPGKAAIVGNQLELLALLHERRRPLVRFVPVRNTLGAESRDGTLCFVISIDTVRFWADVRTSLELSIETARKAGARRIEIWSTGDVDEQSVTLARDLGVTVHQNILEDPVFSRPREADPTLGRQDGVTGAYAARPATRQSAPREGLTPAPEMEAPPLRVRPRQPSPATLVPEANEDPSEPSASAPEVPAAIDSARDIPGFRF